MTRESINKLWGWPLAFFVAGLIAAGAWTIYAEPKVKEIAKEEAKIKVDSLKIDIDKSIDSIQKDLAEALRTVMIYQKLKDPEIHKQAKELAKDD